MMPPICFHGRALLLLCIKQPFDGLVTDVEPHLEKLRIGS